MIVNIEIGKAYYFEDINHFVNNGYHSIGLTRNGIILYSNKVINLSVDCLLYNQ